MNVLARILRNLYGCCIGLMLDGAVMDWSGKVNLFRVAVGLAAIFLNHVAFAQNDPPNKPLDAMDSDTASKADASQPLSWQEAIRLIGQQDSEQANRVEKSLRVALRAPDRSEVIACALILHCVNRSDLEATKAAIAGTRSVFRQPSVETECFLTRVRLWLWISSNEPEVDQYATSTFREIVTHTYRAALPKAELRNQSKVIGTVCGMLSSELADSPIAAENFKIAEQCLLASNSADIRSQFSQSQKNAKKRAEAIEQTIKKLEAEDLSRVAEDQAGRKAKLMDLGYEFTDTRDLMIEVVRNSREVSRQNTLDRRKLADYVKKLNRDWMIPTEGHPGQPPIEPRLPQKSQIKVDEYETKFDGYETRTDADGNKYKVEKEKRERRDQSAIDRERNAKFAQLMADYNVRKADFDRRIAIYVPLLNSWIEADRIRREKMQEERAAAEARSEELLATNKQLRDEASEAKSDFREQRSEVEILAEEYELTDIALKALASSSISIAFRPPHFELIDIEDEKLRLLSRIKK